jgi:CheY-like chemotaxis protein
MRIFRCHDGALLVTHSLSQPVSDRWVASQAVERTYRNEEGIIVQCSHCRRVRRIGTSAARWDWVPDYLTGREANISHGVCTLCVEYHYTPRERDDSPESAETARGSASILVAGEDAPVRSLVARVLRRAGHAVTEARDRAEALRALERDPFDVVLLDESVPGMETDTDAIRVLQPSTRIVGLGTPTDPRRARVLSRIQKPFTPQALLDGVRAALGRLT